MNRVVLMGRLTRDPDVRHPETQDGTTIARYTLAVDRRRTRSQQEQQADFISCVAFGHSAEFTEKYLKKGTKICISGRIQTGSYTNREGVKIYTTDVIVDDQEFAESKNTGSHNCAGANEKPEQTQKPERQQGQQAALDDFMDIPEGIDEELPFT